MSTGILCLDKPQKLTSFGAVARLRRITGHKKAGHTGTLDPMATGVLPVMLSGATRFIDFLPSHEKGYHAEVQLGLTTDTLDITGEVLRRTDCRVTRRQLEKALPPFRGSISQVPPMYSALHSGGQRLYDLARKGIEVEREGRQVTIHRLELLDFDETSQRFSIDVVASKGTYIRSLAADIGDSLGCGATLTALRRTLACGFSLEDAVTLEQLEEEGWQQWLRPVDSCLTHLPALTVTAPQTVRFSNGGSLALERLHLPEQAEFYRVYSPEDRFLGVGELSLPQNALLVKKLLVGAV